MALRLSFPHSILRCFLAIKLRKFHWWEFFETRKIIRKRQRRRKSRLLGGRNEKRAKRRSENKRFCWLAEWRSFYCYLIEKIIAKVPVRSYDWVRRKFMGSRPASGSRVYGPAWNFKPCTAVLLSTINGHKFLPEDSKSAKEFPENWPRRHTFHKYPETAQFILTAFSPPAHT